MISRTVLPLARSGVRLMSSSAETKVAVLGAAGGIGQPLSLLLKLNPAVTDLALYDIVNSPGVAADCSHIDTPAKVKGFVGNDELGEALTGSKIVVVPAGVPRKPGMTRDDLFNTNASIVQGLAEAAAKHCPEAHMLIISNPVNSTVPIVAETFKKAGVYNPKRLFGVTTLDVLRSNTFVSQNQGLDPASTEVTVIGGHAGITILPLLSQVAGAKFTEKEIEELTHRIMFGGDEVVKAKEGAGSATLSMAYAGARFVSSLIRALNGEKGVSECAFVESDVTSNPFFASRIDLGVEGVDKVNGLGDLSAFEKECLDKLIPELQGQIEKGIKFANA